MDASRMMQEFVATALDGISEKILQKYKLMEYSRAFLREQVIFIQPINIYL